MKSHIVGLSFLLCFSANAADWTPVFKHLEVGKNRDQGKTIASLTQGIFRSDPTTTMGNKRYKGKNDHSHFKIRCFCNVRRPPIAFEKKKRKEEDNNTLQDVISTILNSA